VSLPDSPVFHDPEGRRWRRVRRAGLATSIIVTALAAIFIASVLANPVLPRLNLRQLAGLPHTANLKPKRLDLPTNPSERKARKAQVELQQALAKTTYVVPGKRGSHIPLVPAPTLPTPTIPTTRPLSIGFYINWDESSYESLKRNLDHLDWVVPEWSHLQDATEGGNPLATDIHIPALNWIRVTRPQTRILPMVQNVVNENWQSDLLARSIADEPHRQLLIASLTKFVQENKFAGICVDFEEPRTESQPNLLTFMQELHAAFATHNWLVAQAVPFDDPDWNYKAYAAATDYLIVMAYDQHWTGSDAGPVAAQEWFEQHLNKRMRELDPAKTIVALGNYGYDWNDANQNVEEVTFQEALIKAHESETNASFDPATRNPYFEYDEDDGSHHAVWFLDAVTAFNQMRAASGYKPAGYGIWRLGSEDPSIWSMLGASNNSSADALRSINYGYQVDFEGNGELLKVVSTPQKGVRDLEVDQATGFIKSEQIKQMPTSYVIERAGDRPGLLALTFDDGPDPRWTPAILDILKREQVPATFFIVGKNGQAYPDLLRRIVNEGHELGNHTFTHPNLGEMPLPVTELELNATQRLIESDTGRSTVLFRPPYFGDAEADKPQEVEPAIVAQNLGYIMVGLRIDPNDWQLPVTPNQIVNRTISRAIDADPETRGEVILLHDAGGDRSATVEALPTLIHELKARGFRFVSVSDLAGLSRDQVMPVIPASQRVFTRADAVTFFFLSTGGWTLQWIFVIGIVLGLARLLFVGSLAFAQWLRSRRRERAHAGNDFNPLVSIIVPAYNEALVIENTIRSLLASEYSNYEIIVVDDGSTDGTPDVARDFGATVICQSNAGAGAARNAGLARSTGEIVHFMDSDDLASPNSYHVQAALIEAGSDIVYGPWMRTRFDGSTLYPEPVVVQQGAVRGAGALDRMVLTGRWLTVFQPCLFRRATLEAAGPYRTDLKTAEDIELLYRLARRAMAITHAEDTLVLYRVHPENQLSEQDRGRRAVDFARLWITFQENVDARDDLRWADRAAVRIAKQRAAREAREHAPDLARALVSDCSLLDRLLATVRGLEDRAAAKLRFHLLGHRHKPVFAAGKLTAIQRDQIVRMGYAIADSAAR